MLAKQQIARYKRHRPENTLLYQLVEQYYLEFKETLSEQDKHLPTFVERVFNIDISECEKCQKHNVTIIACIIDTVVIQKILAHLHKKYPTFKQAPLLPPLRAPPDEQYANDFKIQHDFNFGA